MDKFKDFLKRKDIVFSKDRYLIDTLSAMALGLFSSLIVGLLLKTIGQQLSFVWENNPISTFLIELGTQAGAYSGSAIGVAIAWALKSPPLVIFSCVVVGGIGNSLGGPVGALLAAIIASEFGKTVSKETKLDILVTPIVTLVTGSLAAVTVGPVVAKFMDLLGTIIGNATNTQPFIMGVLVAVLMGAVLTSPISSAALAMILGLSGLAAGAATAGCAAHMIGFAVASYPANGLGGLLSVGLGTSKLQMPNVVKNPYIILPAIFTSAITGPVSTVLFKLENVAEGAGMGTCGLVGQITTLNTMGLTIKNLISVVIVHIILPAILALIFDYILRKLGKIKQSDYKLPV